jgi:hypothetical protein
VYLRWKEHATATRSKGQKFVPNPCRSRRTMKSTLIRKKNKSHLALQTAYHIMVQYEGRMLVTALVTACTVPKPTSAASAALYSFAAIRLKIMWFISDCVIGLLLGLQPSLYGTLSSSSNIVSFHLFWTNELLTK